jgi:uncharacterized protein (DUF305 family)
VAAAGLALAAAAPSASAAIEDSYSPGEPPVSTTWFGPVSAEARRADLDYIAGMRPHHAGALSMSREYLADPGRSSPLLQALARAIIANQTFEIGMLDEVARNLDRPPVRFGPFGAALQPQATEGLAGVQRFFKEPIPSEPGYAAGPVTERDVQFAKAMIVHHEGALEMARAYHANRDARNGYLGLMNVDIITDQAQEIALMRRAVAAYPGDPDAVRVDPSMVHGMEGMRHGGHGPPRRAGGAGRAPPEQAGGAHAAHHAGHGGQHGGDRHTHHAGHGHQGGAHAAHHAGHGQHGGDRHRALRAGSAARHGAHGRHGDHHAARRVTDGARGGTAPAEPQARSSAQRSRPAAPAAAGRSHHGHHH